MLTVLTDDDICRSLTPALAIAWMREALVAHHEGRLTSPPRVHTVLAQGRLVFTTGELDGTWFGYRSYDTYGRSPGEQVVVVHDAADGRVRAIAVGKELGSRRVGAIGAVAADLLAAPDASVLGLIGTGTQAWAQLWGIRAVRRLAAVRIHSRDAGRRDAFARRARAELGVPAQPATSPQEAVDGADLVVLATSSATPVIDSGWISPGSYVTTVGPKQIGRAEFPLDLVARADVSVTDSLAQIPAYDPPNILAGTPHAQRLTLLGAILAGDAPGRTSHDEVILFCSVGLAGTETYLLDRLVRARG